MAITDYAAYKSMQDDSDYEVGVTKLMISFAVGTLGSLWTANPFGGAVPTTAAALDNTTTGALNGFRNGNGSPLRLMRMNFGYYTSATLMLVDRLSHQGGLSAVVTTAQTTNLPTAALTRYTSGVGVWMGLQIYTQLGTTATTFSVSYTNSSGTSGRTSPLQVIGGTGNREAGKIIPICLQEGDIGVQSVESVTVTATTGTAGAFGVVLFHPLMMIPVTQQGAQIERMDPLLNGGVNIPEIIDDSCLSWCIFSGATGSSGAFQANLRFAEDR